MKNFTKLMILSLVLAIYGPACGAGSSQPEPAVDASVTSEIELVAASPTPTAPTPPTTVSPTNTPPPTEAATPAANAASDSLAAESPPETEAEVNIMRASVASDGTEGNDRSSAPAISGDGGIVVFASESTNLVDHDTNGVSDIFVHDRQSGQTVRVSVAPDGAEANGASYGSDISADGRFVVFESRATNLVSENVNDQNNVYLYDREAGEISLVSVGFPGLPDQGNSYTPSISADGRIVAFVSEANHSPRWDIYVHNRETGQITHISKPLAGQTAEEGIFATSTNPVISADGRFVAFVSGAANLVNDDTNERSDIFVYDRETGETTRASVASDGTQANDDSWYPAISGDGRYVVFESVANNLTPNDPNYDMDVFLHDRQSGETRRVSAALDNVAKESDVGASNTAISSNGKYLVFNGLNLYVYDIPAGQVFQTSAGSPGTNSLDFSADGQFLVYESGSRRVVDNDTNKAYDIFVQEIPPGLEPLEIEPAEQPGAEAQTSPAIPSGETVAFERTLADGIPELPGGFLRLPVPEGVGLEQFDGRLSVNFQTATSPAEVDDFYRTALPTQGWMAENQKYLDFVREDNDLNVSVQPSESSAKTWVRISLNSATPLDDEVLSTIPLLPDAEFASELAGEMGESQHYLTPTDIDNQQLAEVYREFYRNNLYDTGWSVTRDSDYGTTLLTFERGRSKVDISLGESLADKFTNRITLNLFYTLTDSGHRFSPQERGCNSYIIEQANDLNNTPPPADFDSAGYAADKVSAYESLISTAISDGTFELLCASQEAERGQADFEFWAGGPNRYHLSVAQKDDTTLWLILARVDRATNSPDEFLEYRDFNTLRVINPEAAVDTAAEGTGLQDRVFFPLMAHLEAATGSPILNFE